MAEPLKRPVTISTFIEALKQAQTRHGDLPIISEGNEPSNVSIRLTPLTDQDTSAEMCPQKATTLFLQVY